MISNVAVFLFSLSTILFSVAAFRAFETVSLESAILNLVAFGMAWAAGSATGYFMPALRQDATKAGFTVRWIATVVMGGIALAWPWLGPEGGGCIAGLIALYASGMLIPSVIGLKSEQSEAMREAYAKSLIGCAFGAVLGAALASWRGTGALFPIAAAATLLAPVAEAALFFPHSARTRRWFVLPFAALALGLSFVAPTQWFSGPQALTPTPAVTAISAVGAEAVLKFRTDRKFDIYVVGEGATHFASTFDPKVLEASARSLTAAELQPEMAEGAKLPTGVDVNMKSGSGRRRLAAESRRFDLVQIVVSDDPVDGAMSKFGSRAEGTVTVEALRLYFDRLKDDGFLQIVGSSKGAKAQATLATFAEAWKKSARRDVDLHTVALTSDDGKKLETVILRMKPFLREEREKLGQILNEGHDGRKWMLVSDASGAVLTDDRPFIASELPVGSANRAVMWAAIVFVVGLIIWVAMQERRKGLASRWQTASVATYFAGLGLSFAFFQAFFVLRAIRGWGVPTIAAGLVLAAIFVSCAAGATLLAGHPGRRYGVRIQPLANFVFAVMFTYLGAALFEPLVANGSEWMSIFVGMSVLIPFGLLGGSFLPNALEEASEKLAPRVLSLLWALYIAGTALGIFAATAIGLENGLDVVFLSGLFCFAWVAIFSGLLRPWNVRKTTASSEDSSADTI